MIPAREFIQYMEKALEMIEDEVGSDLDGGGIQKKSPPLENTGNLSC